MSEGPKGQIVGEAGTADGSGSGHGPLYPTFLPCWDDAHRLGIDPEKIAAFRATFDTVFAISDTDRYGVCQDPQLIDRQQLALETKGWEILSESEGLAERSAEFAATAKLVARRNGVYRLRSESQKDEPRTSTLESHDRVRRDELTGVDPATRGLRFDRFMGHPSCPGALTHLCWKDQGSYKSFSVCLYFDETFAQVAMQAMASEVIWRMCRADYSSYANEYGFFVRAMRRERGRDGTHRSFVGLWTTPYGMRSLVEVGLPARPVMLCVDRAEVMAA
jgi:hypothetical protein